MSDKQAEAKQKEEEVRKQQQEEQAKRVWALTIVFDPENGQTQLLGNENIKFPWQIDLCIDRAVKNQQAGIVAGSVRGVLALAAQKGKGKIKI